VRPAAESSINVASRDEESGRGGSIGTRECPAEHRDHDLAATGLRRRAPSRPIGDGEDRLLVEAEGHRREPPRPAAGHDLDQPSIGHVVRSARGVAVFIGASVVAMSRSHQPATTAPGIAHPDGPGRPQPSARMSAGYIAVSSVMAQLVALSAGPRRFPQTRRSVGRGIFPNVAGKMRYGRNLGRDHG
jgi:hypothetical protein